MSFSVISSKDQTTSMENQEFQNILQRYFQGQLTDDEYELLIAYLQDKLNREYFEQIKKEWHLNPKLDETGKKNWNRLQFKINKIDSKVIQLKSVRTLWIKIASIAAILLMGILGGGTLTYYISANKINQEELVFETPRGEKSLVKLPDGSQVWLNANSRLVYRSFSTKKRQVELNGEAFFQVTRNENAPFIVTTNEFDVEVLGTTFNVMAYDDFGRKEVTLLSGKVNVNIQNKELALKPGQALVLKDQQYKVNEVNASLAAGWVENKFNFQNLPFSELIKRLENWYDVDIDVTIPTDREINFTGTFKNEETIWQVLDAIKVYTPISYKKTNLRQINITYMSKKEPTKENQAN